MASIFTTEFVNEFLVDFLLRGQAYTPPTNWYIGLIMDNEAEMTTAGTNYARVSYARSLANWAGTQGAGTTTASSGATNTTSNNVKISFPSPSTAWGNIKYIAFYVAATGGTAKFKMQLPQIKQIVNTGDPLEIDVSTLSMTFDQ